MFTYYLAIVDKKHIYYKFGKNEQGETLLFCLEGNEGWKNIKIFSYKEEDAHYEYQIDPGLELPGKNVMATLRVPKIALNTDQISFEALIYSGGLFPKEQYRYNADPIRDLKLKKTLESYKTAKINPQRSTPKIPEKLSDEQRRALSAHRERLEKRKFEYRILSYFFGSLFGPIYSREQKIKAIDHLLNDQRKNFTDKDAEVITQGRTGKILKKR